MALTRLVGILAIVALATVAACSRSPGRGGGGAVTVISGPGANAQLGDADPHPWASGHPYGYPVHGIDVSRWQGEIDWRRVRAAGVRFAYIKATEGGDHSDPAFRRYWNGARAAGMPRGAYHYYYFCRTGAEQARWFIANVPRERGALPPVLDLEWTHSKTCPRRPPPGEIRREAKIFLDMLQRHYGKRPMVYTTVDFYRDNNLGRWPETFWLRSVADHPRETYPGQRWAFWQYTGTGLVPGVQGKVDINTFNGHPETWARWKAGGA